MKLDNVTLGYGPKTVLRDINIDMKPGEFVFLIGTSGSGKTSFIKSLIGDMRPKTGAVYDDQNRNIYEFRSSETASYRRSIGVIFQDYKLLGSKTVGENVAFAMEVCGYKDEYIAAKVPEVLTQVGLLNKKNHFPGELSGGEAQRVAIARALIHNPSVIIGDEPTGNLDPKNEAEILAIFEELHHFGKTIVIATHNVNIVNRMKKRVILFQDGKIAQDTV